MKEFITQLTAQKQITVDNTNTAKAVKSGALEVFATPMMIALMEEATCLACSSIIEDGETTVGTKIDVSHIKASGINTIITAKAALVSVEGRKLSFSVIATDDCQNTIGEGTIERFVVLEEKFMKRVNEQ